MSAAELDEPLSKGVFHGRRNHHRAGFRLLRSGQHERHPRMRQDLLCFEIIVWEGSGPS